MGRFSPIDLDRTKIDQLVFFLIPESKSEGFQAGQYGYRLNMEDAIFAMTFLQKIVGNLGAEVVDVMKANIACKPLQHDGQPVE